MSIHYIDQKEEVLLKLIGGKLAEKNLWVGTAESCTGGRLAGMFASIPEASDHFTGGIVSYAEDVKKNILGVPAAAIEQYGVVSRPVAEQMASGASRVLGCSCALATTGFAGPDGGLPDAPVGTVWIAALVNGRMRAERFLFHGDRQRIAGQSSFRALQMLLQLLDE